MLLTMLIQTPSNGKLEIIDKFRMKGTPFDILPKKIRQTLSIQKTRGA